MTSCVLCMSCVVHYMTYTTLYLYTVYYMCVYVHDIHVCMYVCMYECMYECMHTM